MVRVRRYSRYRLGDTISAEEKTISLFNELKASLEEAVAIQQQRQPAARVTRYEVADVKTIRAALNVSQQEMAEALGTSVDNPSLFRELAAH